MLALRVRINDKESIVAGADDLSVLSAMVTLTGKLGRNAVDPGRGHDCPCPGAIERYRQFGLAPEQGKQRHNQAGTMRGQHRQHEFYGVRQLNRDNGIVGQPGFDEMSR